MKKILKGLFAFLFLVLLSGCAKDYKEITSTKFMDTLKAQEGYLLNTHTPIYDSYIEKSIGASGEKAQFLFFVFDSEQSAKKYVKNNYKDFSGYKYKDYGDYIEVKNTKGKYFRLIQINKTVISGSSDNKSEKKEINNIFKKLGY